MTSRDVSDGDMPNFPWLDRRIASWIDDASLAALLETDLPPDRAAGLRPVADVVTALKAPACSDELAGEAVAVAEFRHRFDGPAPTPCRSRRRKPTVVTPLRSAKSAAVAAIAALGVGVAATTAAVAGALPDPLQQFAHQVFGAPAAHQGKAKAPTALPSASATRIGANARSRTAIGLCTAYKYAIAHGTTAQKAAAFRNLVKAAGGAGSVAAFCAAAPRPSASPSPHPTGPPSPHPTGLPSTHPTGRPSPHATGRPSPHPTGPRSTHR